MNAIIFSRDRACQLECLLRSLYENCDIFKKVTVIYKTKFYESYEIVKDIYPQVKWVEQGVFMKDVANNTGKSHTCLLVDDDIIYKPVHMAEIVEALEECDIVSLRLGKNITNKKHFAVRGSVDGNIFPAHILKQRRGEPIINPTQLEQRLEKITADMQMCWLNESRLVGIPNNRVSPSSGCAHMGGDVNELDNLFIQGYRIDYKSMCLEWDNVHKMEPYILKR